MNEFYKTKSAEIESALEKLAVKEDHYMNLEWRFEVQVKYYLFNRFILIKLLLITIRHVYNICEYQFLFVFEYYSFIDFILTISGCFTFSPTSSDTSNSIRLVLTVTKSE